MAAYSQYRGGTGLGSVLDALDHFYGVPLYKVETVQVGDGVIWYVGKEVAKFKHFEGGEHPYVRFTDPEWRIYGEQGWTRDDDGNLRILPKATLGVNDLPVFEVYGDVATEHLHRYMRYPMLTNYMDHPCYDIGKKAQHFFQGGSNDPKGKWIMIEFWRPEGVADWLKYLEENYVHDDSESKEEELY